MPNLNGGLLDGLRKFGPRVRDLIIEGGMPGAPLGFRVRGATKSGAPTSGTWKAGDLVTDRTGRIWLCVTAGTPGSWVQPGGGATVIVPAPTGATATDTPNVTAAIANLVSALSFGPATLLFADGTYQIDSNSAVIRSAANFTVRSTGATVLQQAPNRSALPNNTTGNLLTIADCTDFTVEGITVDGNRDAVAPITPLTATANSGQASVTVAAGNGARYQVGQNLLVFGGLGASDQNNADGLNIGAGTPLSVSSITPGGGAGGGDLITFGTNLAHTYNVQGGTAVSDGCGPYAWTSDYILPYQCANGNSVAGRSLSGEDQQNGVHLLNCQRFKLIGITARNTWESPIKCGTGERSGVLSLGDACTDGSIIECSAYHGYDQGISLWLCQRITVQGCTVNSGGWANICMTASDYCTITGNISRNPAYAVPGDLTEGNGVAIEGGKANVIANNILTNSNYDGVRIILSPLWWGIANNNANAPTTSTFLEGRIVTAGTSVQVSSTSFLLAGGLYSIWDAERTEAVTVASIIDGTHVTFAETLSFSHASGCYIDRRVAQENIIVDNVINGTTYGDGIKAAPAVRCTIRGNRITEWGSSSGNGINMSLTNTSGPTGAWVGANGSVISENLLRNGNSQAIVAWGISGQQLTNLVITGNRIVNPSNGSSAIDLRAVTDVDVTENIISHVIGGGQGILVNVVGSTYNARVNISKNIIRYCTQQGIYLNVGDACTVDGNMLYSNGSSGTIGQIQLQGITRSTVSNNHCISGSNTGIRLIDANSGANPSQFNRVFGNTCRDDGTGTRSDTGASITQVNGCVEAGTVNYNLFTLNDFEGSTTAFSTAGANSYAWDNTVSGAVAAGTAPPQSYYSAAGLAGATAASRYVGATASGAPASGTFAVGDFAVDQTGAFWICTTAGTPGTWVSPGVGSATNYAPTGLTGATSASRYVGATASGAPATGTFVIGDFAVDRTGAFWVCTTAGSPGTWTAVSGSGGGLTNPMSAAGDTIYGGSAGAATRLAGSTSATPKVLGQTGTGSASAAPGWVTAFAGGVFGPGTDGSVTFDGTTAHSGYSSLSGGNYTLTRDIFTTALTVNSGVTLFTAGYRIFCAGVVTNSGTISATGGNASGATGGTSASGAFTGNTGATGTTGNGSAGGGNGSMLGTGTGNVGGAGASGTAGGSHASRNAGTWFYMTPASVLSSTVSWGNTVYQVSAAGGGGSGGGDGAAAGGGGGGGGGVVAIFAWSVINSGTITAAGGNGANGVAGNTGGGGGGGGGLIIIYTLTAWTAGTTSVAGGTQGSGVGTGAAGTAGTSGSVLNVVLQ